MLTHLECSLCTAKFAPDQPQNLCSCGGPLLARYDLARLRAEWNRNALRDAPPTMWRYAPVLPVREAASIVSLGEGFTPLLPAPRTAARLGLQNLLIKDDGLNPTGSF
jgi:threonine synthase